MILRKTGKCNPTHQNKSNLDCQPDILFPTQRTRTISEHVESNGHREEPNGLSGGTKRRKKKTNGFDISTLVVSNWLYYFCFLRIPCIFTTQNHEKDTRSSSLFGICILKCYIWVLWGILNPLKPIEMANGSPLVRSKDFLYDLYFVFTRKSNIIFETYW